jgi:hypothetical protein
MVSSPVHEFCANPQDAGIDRNDVSGLRHLINPYLDFGSLLLVAFTSDFDTCLQQFVEEYPFDEWINRRF